MVKVGEMLAIWPCIDIRMANGIKKLDRDILFLAKSDNREIVTGFYSKR